MTLFKGRVTDIKEDGTVTVVMDKSAHPFHPLAGLPTKGYPTEGATLRKHDSVTFVLSSIVWFVFAADVRLE